MEKILAVAIFVVMFALIIWDRFPRQWVTLGSGASGAGTGVRPVHA